MKRRDLVRTLGAAVAATAIPTPFMDLLSRPRPYDAADVVFPRLRVIEQAELVSVDIRADTAGYVLSIKDSTRALRRLLRAMKEDE